MVWGRTTPLYTQDNPQTKTEKTMGGYYTGARCHTMATKGLAHKKSTGPKCSGHKQTNRTTKASDNGKISAIKEGPSAEELYSGLYISLSRHISYYTK